MFGQQANGDLMAAFFHEDEANGPDVDGWGMWPAEAEQDGQQQEEQEVEPVDVIFKWFDQRDQVCLLIF
jgi:hypothetical protein